MAEAVTEARDEREALHRLVRATLTRLSRTGRLPVLPGVATAALAIARDPDSEVDDLTNVIQSDVGITARLVRVANSAGYGRQRRAQSIHEAVITVGLRQACSILVAVCARQLYAAPGPYTEVLWNHSLAVALAAEELARVTRRVKVDAVFLTGLFHDVGRIAFHLADAPSFLVIQGLVEAGDGSSTTLEREWYQFDHAQVSAMLSEDWGLGLDQCDAIRWHHDPTRAETGRDIASVLNAADSLAYTIGYGTYPEPPSDVSIKPLGLSADDEAACADRVRQAFEMQKLLIG
jgi:putative nucleotidyltransferase with HDIG domain